MILAALVAVSLQAPSLADLDRMAQKRDVEGLTRLVDGLPSDRPNPLEVLRTNGPYEGGRYGWHAVSMKSPSSGAEYVVLSTFLTNEDIGEFLLKRDGNRLRLVPEDNDLGVQPTYNVLDISFDTGSKKTFIKDTVSLDSHGSGDFVFRMSPEFRITSITDESGQKVPYAQGGGVVILAKPNSARSKLNLGYEGVMDHPNYSASISPDEATWTNDYWYPLIARKPVPYELTIHSPKDWVNVGQGTRVSDTVTEKERITQFRMDLPCVYYSLSSGPYKTVAIPSGGRTFTVWSPRVSSDGMKAQAETYPAIISFYERFAKFPFAGYGALDSPHYGGGAMEAYSYATYGGGFPYVDAHEPSHTWWGGIVENSYLHSFWNESFADFCDGLYHREGPVGDVNEKRPAFVEDGSNEPVYDQLACSKAGVYAGPAASSLGYGKGAKVLQMLEQIMGTGSLISAMHKWAETQPKGKAAEWEDFERVAMAERPDLKLQDFFTDWLDTPGHVDLDASVSYEKDFADIDLRFKSVPKRIPLEVMLVYPNGTRTLKTFDVRGSQRLRVPSPSKPVLVSLDPYRRLLREYRPDETPLEIASNVGLLRISIDPAHADWQKTFSGEGAGDSGTFWIGSPETTPAMKAICDKVGFKVSGDKLTYEGVTIDLNHGAAEAVVDLGGGKFSGIGLGKTRIRPDAGRACVAIFDDLGRFLKGKTEPKTSGYLTYRVQ
ncbi:MAG TPA: hypothetical protein VG944_10530 [Fimbriimonas sp.]|nr:hypothetical protein [Fimbriimonas sp.]